MMRARSSLSTSWIKQTVTVEGDPADVNTVSFPFVYTIYGSAPMPTVSTGTSIESTATSAALGSTHTSLTVYITPQRGPTSVSLETSPPVAASSSSSSPTASSLPAQLSLSDSPHVSRLWYASIPVTLGILLAVAGLYLWHRYGRGSFDRSASAMHGGFEKTGALLFGSTRWNKWRETRRINRQRKVDSVSSDVESMRQILLRRARQARMTRDSHRRHSRSEREKGGESQEKRADSSLRGTRSVMAAYEIPPTRV